MWDKHYQDCIKHNSVVRWGRNGGFNNLRPPAWIPAAPPLAFLRAISLVWLLPLAQLSVGSWLRVLQGATYVVVNLLLLETNSMCCSRAWKVLDFGTNPPVAGWGSAFTSSVSAGCHNLIYSCTDSLSRRFVFKGVSLVLCSLLLSSLCENTQRMWRHRTAFTNTLHGFFHKHCIR